MPQIDVSRRLILVCGFVGAPGHVDEFRHFQAAEGELEERVRRAANITTMAAVTIYPSWALFDLLMAPDWWRAFAAMRFLQAGLILLAYVPWRIGNLRTEVLLYVAFVGMALEIAFMCAVVPTEVLVPYFLGFSTLFLAAGILILWRPVHSAIVLGITLAMFLAMSGMVGTRSVSTVVEHGGFMFLTLAVVSVLVTRMRWQMVRDEVDARSRIAAAHHELERQAEELASSNRELERFAATVSHDLKTPINRLSLAVDVLDNPNLEEAERREVVETIHRCVESASRTINELLQAAQAQQGFALKTRPSAELAEVYAELESDLGAEIREGGGRASGDFRRCPKVGIERGKLKSILLNLMTNAVKFRSPDRPLEIRLRAERVRDFVVVSVSDNGLGMDLARGGGDRLQERQHPEIEGTGLGMKLVKDMAEAAGGRLEVESTPGHGSTFRVWLPEATPVETID